jgi:regulator of sigma E protease
MTTLPALAAIDQVLLWALPFLFVLGVVVVVHELGHFLAARFFNIKVETFSVGFGPEIGGFMDRRGTRWRLAAIPLGGYVKFKGDENAASMPSREKVEGLSAAEREGNFHAAPLGQRAMIVAAGPAANFMLAIVIFFVWFLAFGKPVIEPRVENVQENSAAARAGIQPGDRIVAVSGTQVSSFDELQRVVLLSAGSQLELTVERGGQVLNLVAVPELTAQECVGRLGISRSTRPEDVTVRTYGPAGAFTASLGETWFWLKQPFVFIGQLINQQACTNQLGGPIRIAQMSKDVASVSIIELFRWIAIISISIGILNLFPIPVLDGGHLLFYGAEAILGRPLSEKTQEIGFGIGLALLLMLMVMVTWNDVSQLIRSTG